jgi:hypothetical protein
MMAPDKATDAVLKIARSFPALERKLSNWNPPQFDPDALYNKISGWSHGEKLCAMFVLVIWDPAGAKAKGWEFDFADFADAADSANREALIRWLANPTWP